VAWADLGNIHDSGWETAGPSVKGDRQQRKTLRWEGDVLPPPSPSGEADSGHPSAKPRAALRKTQVRGTASDGCVRPLASIVKLGDLLLVLDQSRGLGWRRTLRRLPSLQLIQLCLADTFTVSGRPDGFGAAAEVWRPTPVRSSW
jgi:hypothetical protein